MALLPFSGRAEPAQPTSGSARTAAARPMRCITSAWRRANFSESTRGRVSRLPPFMRIRSRFHTLTHPHKHTQKPTDTFCSLALSRQIRRVSDRRAQARHHQHPSQPRPLSHHGGFRHLLLHQHFQGGELCLRQRPEGALQGGARGQQQGRRPPDHLPWPHSSARPQHHR